MPQRYAGLPGLPQVIGLEWNQSTDTWTRIDKDGNSYSWVAADFACHPIWGNITRVNLSDAGVVNAEWGDGDYEHDGSNGRVMVEIPAFYVKATMPAANVYRWWISDQEVPGEGFELHPVFYQRRDFARPYIYVGAYEADFIYDAINTHYELHSRTGKQPWTGGQIWEVDFDLGQNEPDIGDDVSTPNDANWFIVDYDRTGGTWAGNDASGKLWIRKPSDAACGWLDNDVITNNTQANQLATCEFTGGALTALGLTIDNGEDYGNNIGPGWGITSIWMHRAPLLLMAIEWGDLDSQTEIGRGIVDKAAGTGFAGELTGSFNIDSNLDSQLTGAGDDGLAGEAQDGLRPIAWRGIENFWGNAWELIIGYNALDAEYRIVNRNGSAGLTYDGTLGAGDYETSVCTPLVDDDGYIDNIEFESLLQLLFVPSSSGGSATTYIPDYVWSHDSGETNILLAGGCWHNGVDAGAGCFNSKDAASASEHNVAARLEFIP